MPWRQEEHAVYENLLHILFLFNQNRKPSNPLLPAESRRIADDSFAPETYAKQMMMIFERAFFTNSQNAFRELFGSCFTTFYRF